MFVFLATNARIKISGFVAIIQSFHCIINLLTLGVLSVQNLINSIANYLDSSLMNIMVVVNQIGLRNIRRGNYYGGGVSTSNDGPVKMGTKRV